MGIDVNISAIGLNRHNHVECDLRQLALVDRVIGLEGQLAYLKSAQAKIGSGDANILRSSLTWRVGSTVLAPFRLAKKVLRRVRKW